MSSLINIIISYSIMFSSVGNDYSIDSIIDTALKNNPDIAISETELLKKQNRLNELKDIVYPRINFDTGLSHTSNPTLVNALGNDTYFAKLSLIQSIYSGDRRFSAIEIAELEVKAKEQELVENKIQLTYDLVKAFYDYMLAVESEKVAKDNPQ